MIFYGRGRIEIIDRDNLERGACKCYRSARAHSYLPYHTAFAGQSCVISQDVWRPTHCRGRCVRGTRSGAV